MNLKTPMNMMLTMINSIHAEGAEPVPLLAKVSSSRGDVNAVVKHGGDDDKASNTDENHRRRFKIGVVYLHGFPDMSVHPITGDFASRVPRKLCEGITNRLEDEACFVCFNFSGLPGSDSTMNFQQKTVSKEVLDAEAVIKYMIDNLLEPEGCSVHVVGLSTGAIIASLLRNKDFGADQAKVTITCIAGLLDVKAGAKLDFSKQQIEYFDDKGYCMKEFWIPPACPIPTNNGEGNCVVVQEPEKPESQSTKVLMKLNKEYYQEMIDVSDFGLLDVERSVKAGIAPLLVVHGTNDIHVPVENGEDLFDAASEPKELYKVPKATHLLTNSKDMKKVTYKIIQFIQENIKKWDAK